MSYKIEGILERARLFQLPIWQYQSLPFLNPYLLASIGYIPLSEGTIRCQICQHEVTYGDDP